MEFKKKELVDMLNTLKPAVGKEGLIEILVNVCFRDGKVFVYNCSVGIVADFDTQGLECLIPFERFYVFIKGCSGENVSIELDGTKINLKSGRSKSTLTTGGDVKDFPAFDNILDKELTAIPNVLDGFKLCAPFAASKASKLELAGVHMIGTFIEATDARRIARYNVGVSVLPEGVETAIFPLDIVKICSNFKDLKGMYVDDKLVILSGDKYIAFGGVVGGKYPQIDGFFPTVTKFIDLPRNELKKGLTTVGDFTGEVADKSRCIVDFGDTIVIKFEDSVAEITEVFNFGQAYPEMKIKLNPYHFDVMLSNCDLFAVQEKTLYGESKDGRFRCVLSLYND